MAGVERADGKDVGIQRQERTWDFVVKVTGSHGRALAVGGRISQGFPETLNQQDIYKYRERLSMRD